jgi:hypothetical protein
MPHPVTKKEHQSDGQPEQEAEPVGDAKLGHEVKVRQQAKDRDQAEFFPDSKEGQDDGTKDE